MGRWLRRLAEAGRAGPLPLEFTANDGEQWLVPGAPTAPVAANERTCRDCGGLTRRRTCGEPVASGLLQRFGVVWPDLDRAVGCAAFVAADVERRPAASGAAAPAPADQSAAPGYLAERLHALGFADEDARRLDADAARRRTGADPDERRCCVECRRLAGHASGGWRCTSARAAGVSADLPRDFPLIPQRCAAFVEVST